MVVHAPCTTQVWISMESHIVTVTGALHSLLQLFMLTWGTSEVVAVQQFVDQAVECTRMCAHMFSTGLQLPICTYILDDCRFTSFSISLPLVCDVGHDCPTRWRAGAVIARSPSSRRIHRTSGQHVIVFVTLLCISLVRHTLPRSQHVPSCVQALD